MSISNRTRRYALGLISMIVTVVSACGGSPSDADVIRHFQENKASYEDLKNLLIADANVAAVDASGVQSVDSPAPEVPPAAVISADRYQQYMHQLQKAGGFRVSRSPGTELAYCIGVSVRGWEGNLRHKDICWHDHTPVHRGITRKVIESGWYLEGD